MTFVDPLPVTPVIVTDGFGLPGMLPGPSGAVLIRVGPTHRRIQPDAGVVPVTVQPVNWVAFQSVQVACANCVPPEFLSVISGFRNIAGTALTGMVVAPAAVAAVVVVAATAPSARAIGGCVASTVYPAYGGVVFQSPSS